jgi:hypothetical protein
MTIRANPLQGKLFSMSCMDLLTLVLISDILDGNIYWQESSCTIQVSSLSPIWQLACFRTCYLNRLMFLLQPRDEQISRPIATWAAGVHHCLTQSSSFSKVVGGLCPPPPPPHANVGSFAACGADVVSSVTTDDESMCWVCEETRLCKQLLECRTYLALVEFHWSLFISRFKHSQTCLCFAI